ncbi:copper transport protein ctr1 [Datura stramonium]|uniref:Copper transport protein ctr1 n=1 Tax=Datura stramonium TaxID=4076 RepID=A0ABS8WJ47_DATST|nr:copper transport protein ctr1 [Datura stramonium]
MQVNGASYCTKSPDGFYLIQGWIHMSGLSAQICKKVVRVPSIESLKAVDPSVVPSVEVILIDRRSDPSLKELQNHIHSMSPSCNVATPQKR